MKDKNIELRSNKIIYYVTKKNITFNVEENSPIAHIRNPQALEETL